VQAGRPTPSRKESPIRVDFELNQTVYIYYMFIIICDTSFIIFHVVDSANSFSVAFIVLSRDLIHAVNQFEEQYIFIHGTPCSLAACGTTKTQTGQWGQKGMIM
jgi:hypothetical protein